MLEAHRQKGATLMIYCPLKPPRMLLIILLGWVLIYPSIGVAEFNSKAERTLLLAAKTKTVKRVKTKTKVRRKKNVKRKTVRKKNKRRSKKPVEIPIDIGIGPAVHQFTGPVYRAQQYHTGLKLSLAAIIDQSVIASQAHKIPKKYRGLAKKIGTVRFRSPRLGAGQHFHLTGTGGHRHIRRKLATHCRWSAHIDTKHWYGNKYDLCVFNWL